MRRGRKVRLEVGLLSRAFEESWEEQDTEPAAGLTAVCQAATRGRLKPSSKVPGDRLLTGLRTMALDPRIFLKPSGGPGLAQAFEPRPILQDSLFHHPGPRPLPHPIVHSPRWPASTLAPGPALYPCPLGGSPVLSCTSPTGSLRAHRASTTLRPMCCCSL